jgi:hypothetical protein
MCRNLTIEGKILIIKTYGLSQLIDNLQCYGILQKELVLVERLIFKFVWSKDWSKLHVCERIKRSVLKAEYEEGGLKAPDIVSRLVFLKPGVATHLFDVKILQCVMKKLEVSH